MKTKLHSGLLAAVFPCLLLSSCALDEYFESRVEQYTKAFIKEFGLVDPDQDWSMGRDANAEINVGAKASSVKIYGKYGEKYYKVADLKDIGGSLSVPVHVPKTCTEMMVRVDGRTYYGTFGSLLNCTGVGARGIPEASYDANGNLTKPVSEKTVGNYKISVQHTESGNSGDHNEYQIFNTQQMGPIVSRDVWSDYYSLNTKEMTYNTNKNKGILPESGIFNADKTYLDNVLAGAVSDVAIDFSVEAGENGKFTLFPYYYGTNLIHELGVYLLNDDGTPKMNGSDYVKLPIFVDKDPGDMQIQPHYCPDIQSIVVLHPDGSKVDWAHPIELNVGDTYQLDVRLYDGKDGTGNRIAYDDAFKAKYHSRIAFHAWVDDKLDATGQPIHPKRFGVHFVDCTEDGLVTALVESYSLRDIKQEDIEDGKYYMQTAIATGLNNMSIDGVQFDFPIVIKDPNMDYDKKEDDNNEEKPEGIICPDGVEYKVGNVGVGEKVIVINNNFADFVGLTAKWGTTGAGVESDGYKYCLFERDSNGNLKKTDDGNVILAAGKVKELYDDIVASINGNDYTIVGEWGSKTFNTTEYEAIGMEYLYENGNSNWIQFDLWVQPRGNASAPRRSRADIPADYQDMLTDNGNWQDVHRAWSRFLPRGKEVASFPVDQPMLARARGYDVTITNSDGTPYMGKFGMYITMKQEFLEDEEGNMSKGDMVKPYTLYSQQKLNEFGQRSAAAFNHPTSGRTFFTFEDMDLTHKAADEGGYAYTIYEKSSDRDVNDLIFLLKGYEKIEGDKTITEKKEFEEEGFNWIWALEDLGSTGDFDFNDVVMRISDITVTTTTSNVGGVEGATETKIARELRFRPLAAGGTLPVHIHFKYDDKDYVLGPGKFDLTKGEEPVGKEWHGWFGNIPSTTMINTGAGPNIDTSDKNACVLIVAEDTSLEEFLHVGDGTKNTDKLYVVVQGDGDETWNEMQTIDYDRLNTNDAYLLPLPEKGKAAQSFFIVDKSGDQWRWMKEYTHICIGYPKFADWVGDASVEWTSDKDTNALYKK